MRYHLSSSNTERFAGLCSQVRELKKQVREKNGFDLVAILVDDGNAYDRLRTGRQVSEALSLTDDGPSVLGDDSESQDSTSRKSATVVNDLFTKGGSIHSRNRHERYMDEVREAIVERAADIGFIIESKLRLPWKKLPKLCARHGVYIDNYPDGVVSPFGNERTARSHNGGIKVLTNNDRKALLDALMSEKIHPMRFISEKRPTDILNNRQPVIVYAPPPADSPYKKSKRIFLNGSFDYQGHPRIPVNGKTVRKRRLVNPSAHKPEKKRRFSQGLQPVVRTLAPTTSTSETRSAVALVREDNVEGARFVNLKRRVE